jgi:hypothetical protein
LGAITRVNAGRAQEQQAFDTRFPRFVDDVGLNRQIFLDELCWIGIVLLA